MPRASTDNEKVVDGQFWQQVWVFGSRVNVPDLTSALCVHHEPEFDALLIHTSFPGVYPRIYIYIAQIKFKCIEGIKFLNDLSCLKKFSRYH